MAGGPDRHGFADRRERMVERQIAGRGITAEAVLRAFATVAREAFVPPEQADLAYDDVPLPIGEGQTISQPYVVALMTEALDLRGGERVLEIGTGSGYAAAILGEIAGEVYTIERYESLARSAREALHATGHDNVTVIVGDGTKGYAPAAPFDAIVVTAAGSEVPRALRDQLAIGGRLVIPVGSAWEGQTLKRIVRREEDRFDEEDLSAVRFVPLVGALS